MSRRTAFNALLTIGGAALLVWQVHKAGGLATIREGLTAVGVGFAAILLISFARFALRSAAWLLLLDEKAPLRAAIAATISGDALGNLSHLSLAASEPAKALYLGRHTDARQALAALAAENFFYTVSIAIYIVVGAAAMLWTFQHLPADIRIDGAIALGAMAMGLVVAAWIALKRPAILSQTLSRVSSRRLGVWIERVRDFEIRVYGSAGPGARRLLQMAGTQVAFHILSFVEAWLALYLLTGRSLPLEAFVLDSVSRAINVIFKLVPLRFGVDQVAAEAVGVAIGLMPGVGLTVSIVRTLRLIVWAAVGLVIWAMRREGPKPSLS
jgi:hypothetical protein